MTGAVVFVTLPDSPSKAWFLNEKEKSAVVVRLAANQTGVDNHKVSCVGLKLVNLHFCFNFIIELALVEAFD